MTSAFANDSERGIMNIGVRSLTRSLCVSLSLEKRVAALERQVALIRRPADPMTTGREWLDDLYGKFAGDPLFSRAMKLGAQYRQSLRPHQRQRKTKR